MEKRAKEAQARIDARTQPRALVCRSCSLIVDTVLSTLFAAAVPSPLLFSMSSRGTTRLVCNCGCGCSPISISVMIGVSFVRVCVCVFCVCVRCLMSGAADLDAMEAAVRTIEMEGLTWGACTSSRMLVRVLS